MPPTKVLVGLEGEHPYLSRVYVGCDFPFFSHENLSTLPTYIVPT